MAPFIHKKQLLITIQLPAGSKLKFIPLGETHTEKLKEQVVPKLLSINQNVLTVQQSYFLGKPKNFSAA